MTENRVVVVVKSNGNTEEGTKKFWGLSICSLSYSDDGVRLDTYAKAYQTAD